MCDVSSTHPSEEASLDSKVGQSNFMEFEYDSKVGKDGCKRTTQIRDFDRDYVNTLAEKSLNFRDELKISKQSCKELCFDPQVAQQVKKAY